MTDVEGDVAAAGQPKNRTFKKFSFKGVNLNALLDMSTDNLVKLFPTRTHRRFQRGLKRKPMALIKKLCKEKREAPTGEKPETVRTQEEEDDLTTKNEKKNQEEEPLINLGI